MTPTLNAADKPPRAEPPRRGDHSPGALAHQADVVRELRPLVYAKPLEDQLSEYRDAPEFIRAVILLQHLEPAQEEVAEVCHRILRVRLCEMMAEVGVCNDDEIDWLNWLAEYLTAAGLMCRGGRWIESPAHWRFVEARAAGVAAGRAER